MHSLSRREVLHSLGLTAATGLLTGCGSAHGAPKHTNSDASAQNDVTPARLASVQIADWSYLALDPAAVAAEAYALYPEGGCMYGIFAGMMATLAKLRTEPFHSFPSHMMMYGAGGVGHWGSVCGSINGGAALIGLFERDKKRRDDLIAELFSWYEKTELPTYRTGKADGDSPCVKTASGSVLCHVSVGRWCKASGSETDSPERKNRCRLLSADVAAKTAELLNANLKQPCKFAGMSHEVKSCLSCHKEELHDTLAKMRCHACHQQLSNKHPTVLKAVSASTGNPHNVAK